MGRGKELAGFDKADGGIERVGGDIFLGERDLNFADTGHAFQAFDNLNGGGPSVPLALKTVVDHQAVEVPLAVLIVIIEHSESDHRAIGVDRQRC